MAKIEAMCLGPGDAGLKENIVRAMFVRPRHCGREQTGTDTSRAPVWVHRKILDRSAATKAHRHDVQVYARHADQSILLGASFQQCGVLTGEDLRCALDGATSVPIGRTAARWVEEPLQPRDKLKFSTRARLSNLDDHRSIID
jgi:hypothetical protein